MEHSDDPQPTFEELANQLDEVLVLLERGDLPLADALAAYERGVTLVRRCNDLLDRAEIRISELSASVSKSGTSRYATAETLFPLDGQNQ